MKTRKKSGLLSAKDIMKGFTALQSGQDIWTMAPIQCLPISEKTEWWIKHNLDWHENIALRELPKKAFNYEKKYNLAAGVINKSDYIYNPNNNDVSSHLGIIQADDTVSTLTTQFFPIAPQIIKTIVGEHLKRDEKIIVDAIDPDSITEGLQFKEDELKKLLVQQAIETKRIAMIKEGLIPSDDPQSEINQQIDKDLQTAQQIAEIQTKYKKFRTIGSQWGQHFIAKYDNYNSMNDIKSRMFLDSLAVDECVMGLDLLDDNFKPLYLEPKKTYINISPSKINYEDANFVVNIEFMSIPEIVNTFRNQITDEQLEKLELQYNGLYTNNVLLGTDSNGIFGSGYYNTSISYTENMKSSVQKVERASDAAINSFLNSASSNGSTDSYSNLYNNQKLIRVSRIWWASQRRVCKLTRIIDGQIDVESVDENFIITIPPIYDNSLLKEKTAKTLISGEHIDSTFIPEWRYGVKIGQNIPYNTLNNTIDDNDITIYLFGEPLPFQRKSATNKYDAKPPISGRRISDKSTISLSLIDQLKPWQIIYNVINNKIIKLLPWDIGPVIQMNESSLSTNSLHEEDGTEPLFEALNNMRENRLIVNKDLATGIQTNGRTMQNQVMDVSTIGKIAEYLSVGQQLKLNAFESIGFTRERLASASQNATATGINQSIETSFTQTEVIFDTFSNEIMPKVYQMILDYGQYYTTKSNEFSDTYINKNLEKVYFKSLKNDLLLRDLHVYAFSKANIRKKMEDLKMLMIKDNTMGATFLDKIKGLDSESPSEIIEKLEQAEGERQQREKEKQELDLQKQREQQEFLAKQSQEQQAIQEKQFQEKLANDRYIAEVKSLGYANDTDLDTNNIPDALEVTKFKQEADNHLQKQLLEQRKLKADGVKHTDTLELAREKLNIEREKIASAERIARENKNSADLKFRQMQNKK